MNITAVGFAFISAALFGLSTPMAKLLGAELDPKMLAGLLYLGSGLGLAVVRPAARARRHAEAPLGRGDAPWLAAAILCGGVVGSTTRLLPEPADFFCRRHGLAICFFECGRQLLVLIGDLFQFGSNDRTEFLDGSFAKLTCPSARLCRSHHRPAPLPDRSTNLGLDARPCGQDPILRRRKRNAWRARGTCLPPAPVPRHRSHRKPTPRR